MSAIRPISDLQFEVANTETGMIQAPEPALVQTLETSAAVALRQNRSHAAKTAFQIFGVVLLSGITVMVGREATLFFEAAEDICLKVISEVFNLE
jgi:hypothetical protein